MKVENKKPYNKLWAFLSVDKKGHEGICMINGPYGPALAVTGSEDIREMYKKHFKTMEARMEANRAGMKIVIGEFYREGTFEL